MTETPLQAALASGRVPLSEIMAATGRSRQTVWRWRRGNTFPRPEDAETLCRVFGAAGVELDFAGCYRAVRA